jgi:hypothetical protein
MEKEQRISSKLSFVFDDKSRERLKKIDRERKRERE